MTSSISATHNNDPPKWYYDAKRKTVLFPESENAKAAEAARKAKAAAERKEQEAIFKKRRAQQRLEEKRLQEKRDADRRVSNIEGRIKQLTTKALADKSDTKSRSELSYARTQLFWARNAHSP